MALSSHQKYHLKKLIGELDSYSARHTEFVTVYVPKDYDLNKIMNHLSQEQGTATNIKSAQTRNNVIDALERMMQRLKLVGRTPPNGLAIFSGNVASKEGASDVRVWDVEPPIPIKTRIYRCDKRFQTDILIEMLDVKEIYGLIVLDARDAIIAQLKGKAIIPLLKTHSHVPGKMKAGGQSAHRFQQNRDLAVKAHLKKVAEYVKEQFLAHEGLKGILIGGPGPTKYDFAEKGFLTGDVQKKVLAIKDLSYTEEFGLEELVDKSQDILAQEEIAEEKKVVYRFLELLATKPAMIAYGIIEVRKVLGLGVVATLLLSEDLEEKIIDELEEKAKEFSTETKIISTDTREGVQLRDLGKVGAILRYELNV